MTSPSLITLLGHLLPPSRREWSEAMRAELDAIPAGPSRTRFWSGCVRTLLVQIVAVRLRIWTAYPGTLAAALAAGLLIAVLDRASETRGPMWVTLLAASAIFAWCRPVSAWRWGLLLAIGIPCLRTFSETPGPYTFDRADALYGMPPAIFTAAVVAGLRRRLGLRLLTAAAILGGAAPGADGQTVSVRRELAAADIGAFADSLFADYVRSSPQPSLAFVVVKDGSIVFARGYGSEDAAGSRRVDPEETLFWMASLSKLITTEAVMREVERGRVALAAPAGEYLDWALPTRKTWRAITVEDLLTHTSGLDEPFMQGSVDDAARLVSLGAYLSGLRWRAGSPPGEVLRYSNHALALAGRIVERTSGVPFAEYVEREVFAAAGMDHSTFHQPIPPDRAKRIATAGTNGVIDYLLPAPAGAMVGSAIDMGRFLGAQLDIAGAHATALDAMHATHWRAHPAVPGVALGWFETNLGGIPGLYHTGARHHFSVAWLAPEQRVGLFLVHSMHQGGRFQTLRTEVVRAFAERYFVRDTAPAPIAAPQAFNGVYRPALLSTTTIERAGYLFLDTPVRSTGGGLAIHAPAGLGTLVAYPTTDAGFEVREGPQAGLRVGFLDAAGQVSRMAMGGTLLDPVVFTRLAWWQRGLLHALLLGIASSTLVIGAVLWGIRRIVARKRGIAAGGNSAWWVVAAAGTALLLAPLTLVAVVLSTPEIGASDHMRTGLRVVLTFLSAAAVLCASLPIVTLIGWKRRGESVASRVVLVTLAVFGAVASMLLWHYRLVGFHL